MGWKKWTRLSVKRKNRMVERLTKRAMELVKATKMNQTRTRKMRTQI